MKFYACLLPLLLCCAPSLAQVRPAGYRIETIAGSQRDGDGGPAISAQISKIQGVAVDRAGNLYLSDTDHHRVRKVSPGGTITTVAGTGVAGYAGDGGAASQAQLNLPYGLAVDGAGNLYIADLGNNRIRRVWADGVISTLIPNTPLATPRNLALDADGNLYVSEFDGHRVRRISSDGQVTTAAGNGRAGFAGDGGVPELAQLSHPAGIAIDRGGALLIADSGNNRIRRTFSNGTINTILGGSSGTALATPVAVAVDAQGNIYTGDTAPVVRVYSLSGRWSDAAGGASPGYSGDGGPAIRASLTAVRDMAVDAFSNLYIADGLRVRRVDVLGMIATVAGDGYVRAIGDNGPAQDGVLARPSAVTVDASGVMRIADTGTQRVREVAGGVIQTLLAGLNEPMGVASDGSGTLYIADTGNSLVRALGADRRLRTVTAAVRNPRGVCVDRAGTPYVADTGNGRVLRVGAAGVEILGSQMNAPESCAFDGAGNLYVAETGAHRVVRRSVRGDWSAVAADGLAFPRGVAVDGEGNVYVSDTGGNRIRVVRGDGSVETIAGSGAAGYSGDGGDALAAKLNGPAGLWVDAAGQVYFADGLNDRVRRLVPDAALAEQAEPVSVVNAMSGEAGSVAPGELVTVSGKGFGESGCEVWIGGRLAPVMQSAAGQVTVQVPDELTGLSSARLEVRVGNRLAGVADLAIVESAPGVLPLALNFDGSWNNGMRPALTGSTVYLFATGQGRLEAARPSLPVGVTVSGMQAEVVSAMAVAPGLILVAVRVPGGYVAAGQSAVVLTVGNAKAAPVTVWVQ